MYTQQWIDYMEISGMQNVIDNTTTSKFSPLEILEEEERVSFFDILLNEATSAEEKLLLDLIDKLVDEAWELPNGKAIRGRLRQLFCAQGYTWRQYNPTLRAIKRKFELCH